MSSASTIEELLHAIESSKHQYQQQQQAFANNMAQRLIVTMQQIESGLPCLLGANAYEFIERQMVEKLQDRCQSLKDALDTIDWKHMTVQPLTIV